MNSLGFVPVDEIQNIFVQELREIEEDIGRNGVPMDKAIVFEWIDNIRLKVHARAQHNLDKYMRSNPIVVEKKREEKEEDTVKDTRKESYIEKVKKNRDAAIADCYK